MELTLDQALLRGIEAHKAGKAQKADQYYTAILKANPKHPDANHNMGVLAVGVGKVEAALPFFKTALEVDSTIAQYWLSYIDALIKLDRFADAKAVFDQAKSKGVRGDGFDKLKIQLSSSLPIDKEQTSQEVLNTAIELRENGKYDDAIIILKNSIGKFPSDSNIPALLSHCYILIDNLKKAKIYLEAAKNLDPSIPSVGWNETRLLLKKKKIDEAIIVAKKTSKLFPDDIEGMSVLGSCLRANGKFDQSLKYLNRALELNPNYAEALIQRGLISLAKKDTVNALLDLEKAYHLKKHIKQIWHLVLNLKMEVKDFKNTIAIAEQMVQYNPLDEKIFASIALCHHKLKNYIKAELFFKKAISIKPDYAEAWVNLGLAVKDQGRLDNAIEAFKKAISIKPDFAEAYNNMGTVLKDLEKLDEAIEAFKKAISIKPDFAEAYNNMGTVLKDLEKLDEAIEAYNKALSIKSNLVEAWSNGAEALEAWNKLNHLEIWLDKAFNSFETVPADLRFLKSKMLWRKKKYEQTSCLIEDIKFETISEIRKQDYLQLKAKCFEKFQRFGEAYKCFAESNSFAKNSKQYLSCGSEQYFQNLKDELVKLKSSLHKTSKAPSLVKPEFSPIFLVGFPRSGTTLLDTILRSNSKISVVEEKGMLSAARNFLNKNCHYDFIVELIPPKLIIEGQKVYEEELKKYIKKTTTNSVFIDKLPLNLLQAPLINQLYPDAKFILALRHPMDTILSCWMQNFRLNEAMANMVDLDRIVEFYCIAMETFKICRTNYNFNIHEIRYEDLINNFHKESKAVVEFLNLQWEPEMENYQNTALKRGHINTPSYSQVIQPIYKDAQFRWLNYQKHLEQYLDQVKPWISEFGYNS